MYIYIGIVKSEKYFGKYFQDKLFSEVGQFALPDVQVVVVVVVEVEVAVVVGSIGRSSIISDSILGMIEAELDLGILRGKNFSLFNWQETR